MQRRRRLDERRVVDAGFYGCRSGGPGRNLPAEYPAWAAGSSSSCRWHRTGLWPPLHPLVNALVNALDRVAHGRAACAAGRCAASQRGRRAPRLPEHRGLDGGKFGSGRPRPWLGEAGAAGRRPYRRPTSTPARRPWPCPRPGWAGRGQAVLPDNGYRGRFARHRAPLGRRHEGALGPPSARGVGPGAQRGGVPCPCAGLTGFRRLAREYESPPPATALGGGWLTSPAPSTDNLNAQP